MIRSLFLICILSLNLSAENNEQALKESLLKFWEARNARDFETIFFYESKSSDDKSKMLILIEVAFIEPPLLVWREISLVIAPQIAESNFRTNIK